jgi:hypothetical protein
MTEKGLFDVSQPFLHQTMRSTNETKVKQLMPKVIDIQCEKERPRVH